MQKRTLKLLSSIVAIAMLVALMAVPALAVGVTPDGTTETTDGAVTISGTVTDPVANQQVTMVVYTGDAPTEETIVYIDQVGVDSENKFSKAITLPEAGTYNVKIGATSMNKAESYTIVYGEEEQLPEADDAVAAIVKDSVNFAVAGVKQASLVVTHPDIDTAAPAHTLTYDGVELLWSPQRQKFVGYVPQGEYDASKLVIAAGTPANVYYGNDLDGNETIHPLTEFFGFIAGVKDYSTLTMAQFISMDVDGNGRVNVSDLNALMAYRSDSTANPFPIISQ